MGKSLTYSLGMISWQTLEEKSQMESMGLLQIFAPRLAEKYHGDENSVMNAGNGMEWDGMGWNGSI